MIAAISFISRTFSVIKFESVIHEFDPWFNFRSTRFMDENGVYGFHNWFDSESWHPLGRVVGGTVYPGLMFTSCFIKWFIDWLSFPIDIRNICVFLYCESRIAGNRTCITTRLIRSTWSWIYSCKWVMRCHAVHTTQEHKSSFRPDNLQRESDMCMFARGFESCFCVLCFVMGLRELAHGPAA